MAQWAMHLLCRTLDLTKTGGGGVNVWSQCSYSEIEDREKKIPRIWLAG